MRDAVIIDLNKDTELIITTDGCTGVGTLKEDLIRLDLRTVAWTACKVALMELLSIGASPIGYAFNHIASPDDYSQTVSGITQCMEDFGQTNVPFISSSEKNFIVSQTTITIALTGIRLKKDRSVPHDSVYLLIGDPLVGQEVLERPDRLVTPEEFMQLLSIESVSEIIPIGSHGVLSELVSRGIVAEACEVDLNKSAGPATCVIAAVNRKSLDSVLKQFGDKCRIVGYGKGVEELRNGVFHA